MIFPVIKHYPKQMRLPWYTLACVDLWLITPQEGIHSCRGDQADLGRGTSLTTACISRKWSLLFQLVFFDYLQSISVPEYDCGNQKVARTHPLPSWFSRSKTEDVACEEISMVQGRCRTWECWREELTDSSHGWEPQLFRGKWESGDLEEVGFELGLEGCSHQERNKMHPWLMGNREGKIILQCNIQYRRILHSWEAGRVFLSWNLMDGKEQPSSIYQRFREYFMMMDFQIFRSFI